MAKDVRKGDVLLIQFGHNDQPGKPGRSTDLATEFPANLARYVSYLRAAGATPLSDRELESLEAWFLVVWLDPMFHGEPEAAAAAGLAGLLERLEHVR